MEIYKAAAVVVATVLGVDALFHAYWMTGRTWPARDVRTLSKVVLNADVPFTPRVLAPLVAILTAGALAVLARAGLLNAWLPQWMPEWVPFAVTLAVALGTFLRFAAGIVWALGIGARPGSTFYLLNVALYTPLCLVLCGAAMLVLANGRPAA